jgi:acyl carrier protein phosphodiesterase
MLCSIYAMLTFLKYKSYFWLTMNYLAHAFLSFNNGQILVGNLINDFVKGNIQQKQYTILIQNGMALHKKIDAFTDAHAINKEAKKIFAPSYRLYAAAFLDVCYDHFLAKNFSQYSSLPLMEFTLQCYQQLNHNQQHLPENFAKIVPSMQKHNWLFNYQFNWAMAKSFEGLKRRATFIVETDTAYNLFESNYAILEQAFNNFFPELYAHSVMHYKQLIDS